MQVLQQYFPRDIANMIDTMKSHAEHHDLLEACFIPLQIKVLIRQFQRTDLQMIGHNQHELDRKLREDVPDLQHALTLLAQCRCCVNHQESKPTSTDSLQLSEYRVCYAPTNTEKSERLCKCPCRHYARRLTRAHLYSLLDHEEDNRCILHEVFLHTHETLKTEIAKLSELKKRRKQKLRQMNSVMNNEDYLDKYHDYKCEYYQIMSEIEEQEIAIHTCEEKDTEITHMLENHILDFPGIRNELDGIFTDMFIYPGYDIMYDTDMTNSDEEMTDV